MAIEDHEEQLFQEDVKAVKQWWSDSRWRYTRRPFKAEQIVAKRGNLKIQYPSNDQSKKLWSILEHRFKVLSSTIVFSNVLEAQNVIRTAMQALHMAAWNLQRLPKWPNIWILFTCRAGSARRPPLLQMNHHRILQTILMYALQVSEYASMLTFTEYRPKQSAPTLPRTIIS